jgi:hypothetical protein
VLEHRNVRYMDVTVSTAMILTVIVTVSRIEVFALGSPLTVIFAPSTESNGTESSGCH